MQQLNVFFPFIVVQIGDFGGHLVGRGHLLGIGQEFVLLVQKVLPDDIDGAQDLFVGNGFILFGDQDGNKGQGDHHDQNHKPAGAEDQFFFQRHVFSFPGNL